MKTIKKLLMFLALTIYCFQVVIAQNNLQGHECIDIEMPQRGICAHRGAMATHPENTIAAFKEAIRLGAHVIEFDVHWTKDRRFVVLHDHNLDRTTNGTGDVVDHTLADLNRLDAGSWKGSQFAGEHLPTLEETLEMMPKNIWLFVDIQFRPHLAAPVAREILRQNRQHQCIILVRSHKGLEAARQVDPGVLVCNMNRPGYDTKNVTDVISHRYNALRFTGFGPPENVQRLKEANVRILFCCLDGAKNRPSLSQLFDAGIDFPMVNDLAKAMSAARKLGIQPLKPVY